jgi:hypothetical protein
MIIWKLIKLIVVPPLEAFAGFAAMQLAKTVVPSITGDNEALVAAYIAAFIGSFIVFCKKNKINTSPKIFPKV